MPNHVKNLAASFANGIRRRNDKERMLVTMSRSDFEKSVSYTAEQLQTWHKEGKPVKPYTVDELKGAYTRTAQSYVDRIEAVPPLLWAPTATKPPQLERGQHRRKALMQYMENRGDTSTSYSPDTPAVSQNPTLGS
jgi:hypothetical protein